ncbi:MAG: nucleotidyltransferase family protein [Armatimonadetes bacterium]|nr:nucleotidyltransferase family protein [Armatimonadota bacterium]
MDVVVLAGGRCEPELAEKTGVELRADLPYHGQTIVERVLEAVRGFGHPVLVGGRPGSTFRQVPAGESFVKSLSNGIAAVQTETFLLVTGDLPCLEAAHVQSFLDSCDSQVALNYPIIPASACEREFPGMKRTTLRLREGEFTGGNIALMRTVLMHRAMPILERAYAFRKSPIKLASMLGVGTLAKVALARVAPKTLSVASLEGTLGRFLEVPVKAIVTEAAAIGADIDTYAQYKSLIDLKKPG